MSKLQAPFVVNTGLSTQKPADDQTDATAMKDGGSRETKPKENATPPATPPKARKNTKRGKEEMPASKPPPLLIPRPISRLIDGFRNEATEIYIAPDSIIAFAAEASSIRRDAGCWILFRLPPIQTNPRPQTNAIYPIKGPIAP